MMSSKNSELPKWACPNCGKIFRAISETSLDKKAEQHLDSCDVEAQSTDPHHGKEDHKYTIKTTAPRDPDEYWVTDHFQSMKLRREDPEITTEIINEVVKKGHIKSGSKGRYIFEHEIDGWRWWIVVELSDEAFLNEDKKHIALTVYSPDSKSHEEVVKYV